MPIYEYACAECGERFERLTTTRDKDARVACPSCGAGNSERVPSSFALGRPSKLAASCTSCCPGGTCGL